MDSAAFSCLGVEWLGQCRYNPGAPTGLYFSLGEVIGALAFTLAAQQLLKQVVLFRLSARYLALEYIYVLVFIGVGAAIIAALVPNFPLLHGGPWGYAINWEVCAAVLFVVAYGAVVLALVRPVSVHPRRIEDFARGAGSLLSSANESDHIDFTLDLQRSLPTLIKSASFDQHERNTSAFHDFTFRVERQRAAYSDSLLRIIADPQYCQTLVARQPWRTANMLREISEKNLHCRGAEQFVRELAYQAITRDESMMTREVGYYGFRTAPLLSESLFSNWFIVTHYNPLDSFFTASGEKVTPMLLKRFNSAAERCYRALIDERDVFHAQVAFSIQSYYRSVFMRAHVYQGDAQYESQVPLEMQSAIEMAVRMANRLLARVNAREYEALFVSDNTVHRHDVLETLVEIVYEALNGIANKFKGYEDVYWILAMDVMRRIFQSISSEPDGLTPFQQRVALKLLSKLRDNMNGFCPSVIRVLLVTVGPYNHAAPQHNATAFNILKDVLYIMLRQLPKLAQKKPEKIKDYFPPSVSYDVKSNRISHAYRGGQVVVTDLSLLHIPALSLLSKSIRRPLTSAERKAAEREF